MATTSEITVAFTVSGLREKYLRDTLDSWARVRGISGVRLLFLVEPNKPGQTQFNLPEFQGYLLRTFSSSLVLVNETRLGCLANTRAAMDKAFGTGAEFTILAEEDLSVSDDVLEYFTWAQRYRADQDVTTACAHTFRAGPRSPRWAVVKVDWFSPLVWGTWPDRWCDFIRPAWAGAMGNSEAWDLNLRLQIVAEHKVSVFPGRSRSIHRGTTSTLVVQALADHFYRASLTNCFQPHYNPQDWREIPRDKELELVV